MRSTPLLAGLLILLAAGSASAQTARRPFLFKDARGDLATARVKGDADVVLLVAAMPGKVAAAAKKFAALGGTLQYRDDNVDYLRGRLPVDAVEAFASDPSVYSVAISVTPSGGSGGASRENTIAATDTANHRAWPPPLLSWYPVTHRYDPLGDLRAADWRKQNPTFDGRGVTLAIIDMSFDPLLPELQSALTLDGKPVAKIAGYQNALDGEVEPDGRWLAMKDTVRAVSGRFDYEGRTYTAPRDGTFRIELLDEAVFDSLSNNGLDRDLNRDGNPEGSSRLFAVLWDGSTDDVWVDTDQDSSFTDEKMLTDYRTRPEFGVFGSDDPATSVRESVGFGIQIDRKKDQLAINAGLASHASLVVGAAVGSRGEHGRFNGVAPGARVYDMAEGCAAYGQTEAVIQALENPKIDLAWLEQCSNITRPYTLRDGRMTTTVIYERLIAKYKKPMIIPTHNYPVLGGTDDIVMAAGAIGIGGHESKENFFTNHGVRVEHDDNLLITGGYGPMGNGAFGADVISPSNYISTARGWEETRPIAGSLYRLPPGYTIAGGTSTATPTSAGAVALLISAARQSGIKYDAFRIRQAIISSARYVPHLPVYKQGSGVLNVAGAWEVLKALDKMPDPVTVVGRAPVHHVFSETLPTPDEGVGLFERSGWSPGQSGERVLTFTRTSGPRGPMAFAVNLTGNDDGTYSVPASVTLPLNRPVSVNVAISPKDAGAHTAMLTLTNPDVPGFVNRMLLTIVAGEPLNAANHFTAKAEVEVPRPEMRSFFYEVPAGTNALRVDVEQPKRDVSVAIVRPDTRTASAVRTAPVSSGRGGSRGRSSRATYVVTDPMPGVWEVRLTDIADVSEFDAMQAEKEEPVPPTPATLTVSAISADPEAGQRVTGNGNGGASTRDLTMRNRMASFEGGITGAPMGAARRARPTIRQGEQLQYEIDVPAGSSSLLVRASDFADAAADLDVYVFDCTGKECRNPQTDSDPVGAEVVTVQNPAVGKWKVVVDGSRVPSGSTTFSYLDAVFNPSWGATVAPDTATEHATGESWPAQVHTWLAGPLPAGRQPFAGVSLEGRLSAGVTFGLGFVELPAEKGADGSSQR